MSDTEARSEPVDDAPAANGWNHEPVAAPLYGRMTDLADEEYSEASADSWEEFLQNYSIRLKPDVVFKLRKQTPDATLSACVTFPRLSRHPVLTLSAKPRGQLGKWVKKATLTPEEGGSLELASPVIPIPTLVSSHKLRLTLHASLSREHGAQLDYRLRTGLGSKGKTAYSKKMPLTDELEVRPYVKVDAFMPEVSGSFGAEGGERTVETGHCHVSVPRLLFCHDLSSARRPPSQRKPKQLEPEPHVSDPDLSDDQLVAVLVPRT